MEQIMEELNQAANQKFSKRDIYLMAKYVTLADYFDDFYDNKQEISPSVFDTLEKNKQEIQDIVEEWNTSKCSNIEEMCEHDFLDDFDREKVDKTYEDMGGRMNYYPATFYDPPEYEIVDEDLYADAEEIERVGTEMENMEGNVSSIKYFMDELHLDIDKSEEYVNVIEKSGDKEYLNPSEMDEELAKQVVKQYHEVMTHPECETYLTMIIDYHKAHDALNEVRLFDSIDEKKDLESVIRNAQFRHLWKNNSKLTFTDDMVNISWDTDTHHEYEIKYDGTAKGFYEAMKEKRGDRPLNPNRKDKNMFADVLERDIQDLCVRREKLPAVLDNFYNLAQDYKRLHGENLLPELKERMEIFESKENILKKDREYPHFGNNKFYWLVGDLQKSLANFTKDTDLRWKFVAAKRLLNAYHVLQSKAKKISVENSNEKPLEKSKGNTF